MKNILDRLKFNGEIPKGSADQKNNHGNNRRDFIKNVSMSGLGLGMLFNHDPSREIEFITQKVNRAGSPSELKITDLRVAVITGAPMTCPIIRIDTNQGISGYGEIRDGASAKYGLFLKSRLLGKNPCNVEYLFKTIKQFGGHGRAAGGVCGVEMALWDLAGKAFNVPCYQMLGGKFRDQIRIYGDTPEVDNPAEYAKKMQERQTLGLTFLKMDFGIELLAKTPGTVIGSKNWDYQRQWGDGAPEKGNARSYSQTRHPFTRVQITDKGLDVISEYVAKVRDAVGYEIPLAADHFGHFDVNTAIRLGKALEKYQLAWLEDMVPWNYTEQWKQITDAIQTPTLTGEDIYLKEDFIKLIDARAVDMIQPDLASSGGLLETKKIGDYAEERGIPMAMHFAGSPVCFMANLHCAAATENFVALEHHSFDVPWWEDLVTGADKPIFRDGFAKVPDRPGLGVELNEKVVKEHLKKGELYFAPTTEWDKIDSWDREWS
ncbi:mandelate racemase/muconate lactonizing enzyme family protein [Flavihumibacter fluvii]|uniref:mandelate racemase/muconate lactonizing enzyme family protein n=1 Tax=Flavihumibacter fluvii TaxID=2838157 RepID=UPI001BDE131E|nr:mandelate racemase/muconate lactonizing enzyme family protein [Flavihumibacter fluvii]ULQ50872.1 mandelate racemase/muconate lactonizing enzyme family protein [Flavihumibacter fluvii]